MKLQFLTTAQLVALWKIAILDHYMSVSNVKLPILTTRYQKQYEIAILDH